MYREVLGAEGTQSFSQSNQLLDCLNTVVHIDHTDAGVVHALEVLLRAEQANPALSVPVGLHALKDFLSIVQHHAGRINLEGSIGDNPSVMPAVLGIIVHQEHMVSHNDAEGDIRADGLFFIMSRQRYRDFFHFISTSMG